MKKKNISLIGMPGSGKSTVGALLAERLGLKFLDIDIAIKGSDRLYLQDVLDELGEEEFLKRETKEVLALIERQGYVFAPGGSVVYSSEAMQVLKNISLLVYLIADPSVIEKRIDLSSRGIVGLQGKTFEELYDEREILYKKYADATIDTSGKDPAEIAEEISILIF